MNSHISNTWFWANLLHPFVMLCYFDYSADTSGLELFGDFLQLFIYSLIFSLPSLFISFLGVYLISLLPVSAIVKYITWIIAAPLIVLLNFLLILLLFGGDITLLDLEIATPAMIAVVIIVLIRYKQFLNISNQLKETKHENNMV